jgi:hypothetical protein
MTGPTPAALPQDSTTSSQPFCVRSVAVLPSADCQPCVHGALARSSSALFQYILTDIHLELGAQAVPKSCSAGHDLLTAAVEGGLAARLARLAEKCLGSWWVRPLFATGEWHRCAQHSSVAPSFIHAPLTINGSAPAPDLLHRWCIPTGFPPLCRAPTLPCCLMAAWSTSAGCFPLGAAICTGRTGSPWRGNR